MNKTRQSLINLIRYNFKDEHRDFISSFEVFEHFEESQITLEDIETELGELPNHIFIDILRVSEFIEG